MKKYTPTTEIDKKMLSIFQTLTFGSKQKLVELGAMAQSAEQFVLEETRNPPPNPPENKTA